MNVYSVIIGTELLNGRRDDKHFDFINKKVLEYNFTHKASFVVCDDVELLKKIFTIIKEDRNSIMFSFGGIGATPDDYTREVAASIFRAGRMRENLAAKDLIINQFGDDAYPHRVNMANLPINCDLINNPINQVPAFSLDDKYFFLPGFTQMSHPMIDDIFNRFSKLGVKHRLTLSAKCSENDLIDTMKKIDESIELSSLPIISSSSRATIISLSSDDRDILDKNFKKFISFLEEQDIYYELRDNREII